ncbi:MAG: hypothetical protein JXA57_09140 [Armatimonadetes bacterium]|nr:hypothetical protein [Armatimonadota bacterium]
MAKNLIVFGLGLIAAWVLLKLVSFVMEMALWAGALLIIIGLIWHFVQQSELRARRT